MFIDTEYAARAGMRHTLLPIVQMWRWLKVSKSGFYDWKTHPESDTARRRELLKIKIKALFEAPWPYGSSRRETPRVRRATPV